VSYRGSPATEIGYNNFAIGGPDAQLSIVSRDAVFLPPFSGFFSPFLGTLSNVISGNYALFAQTTADPIILSQMGVVPADATFFRLTRSSGPIAVLFNGTPIASTGGDISAFAGELVNLQIILSNPPGSGGSLLENFGIDRLEFAPEPGTLWMASLGAVAFLIFAVRKSKHAPGGSKSML